MPTDDLPDLRFIAGRILAVGNDMGLIAPIDCLSVGRRPVTIALVRNEMTVQFIVVRLRTGPGSHHAERPVARR